MDFDVKKLGLVVIGENINTTRNFRANGPRVTVENGKPYVNFGADKTGRLDISASYPKDESKVATGKIPHVAEAVGQKNTDYIRWLIESQLDAGAHIIDLCVDAMSTEPEERHEWMRWIVKLAQTISPETSYSIDSSDSDTIIAGIEAYDKEKSRPAINSINLEEGRSALIPIAKDANAILFANASGRDGMPQNDEERVNNLVILMDMMDQADIPMADRYLDPLVFPIGAGPEFGKDYVLAVKTLRTMYPEVKIFGGHSNVSFGLPKRKVLNDSFVTMSIIAGCDSVMIDPVMNPPQKFIEFRFAAEALLAQDQYATRYLKFIRAQG